MKKVIASAVAILCATAIVFGATRLIAQPERHGGMKMGGTPEERATRTTQMLKERLSLTDDQAAKIQKINADAFAKEKELMDQIQKLQADRKKAVESVLTPEQQEKMKEFRSKMQEKGSADANRKGHMHKNPKASCDACPEHSGGK